MNFDRPIVCAEIAKYTLRKNKKKRYKSKIFKSNSKNDVDYSKSSLQTFRALSCYCPY